MPIKIKCPSCKAVLGVKESLAGKKAACPKCRFVLTIPMPKPPVAAPALPPPEDAEAVAASTFADAPAPVAKPASTQQIEFECPFCAELIKVSVDLCGKQAPCPNQECKRIVKVPLLKEEKPKDWRQVNPRGPSGAMQKNDDAPADTWSTAQKTRVSTAALIEADAIPEKKEPVTFRTWVKRGTRAALGLAVLIAAWWGIGAWISSTRLYGTLNNALEAVDKAKPNPAQTAAIHRGAAEFYVTMRQPSKAMEHFVKARGLPSNAGKKSAVNLEHDAVLTGLALAIVNLGGSDSEVLDKERLEWEEVQKELLSTLRLLSCDESKQSAMREVGRKLMARDQAGLARFLTNQLAAPPPLKQDQPEPVDGQEGEQPKEAKAPAVPAVQPLAAQQIGLLHALKENGMAKQILAPPILKHPKDGINDPVVRLAWAEGWAREGNFDKARVIARAEPTGDDTALDRIEASLAVAAIALMEDKKNHADINLGDAKILFHKLPKDEKSKKPGLLLQFARVAARLDKPLEVRSAEVRSAAEYMPDQASKSLALLELVMAQIETTTEPLQGSLLDEQSIDKESLAYGLGLEKIARHNTRLGHRSAALALTDGLDDRLKAFVYMGVALGILDARQ